MDPVHYTADANAQAKPGPAPGTEQPETRFASSAPGVLERGKAQLNEWNLKAPSWSRGIITLAVVVALGVGVALSGTALAAFFVAGAMTLTMAPFLLWVAWFVGWCVAIYFGAHVMFKVAKYFLSEKVDHDLARLRDGTFHALTPSPKPQHG